MAEGHGAGVRLLQCAAHTSLQKWQGVDYCPIPTGATQSSYGHYLFAFIPPRTTLKLLVASPGPLSLSSIRHSEHSWGSCTPGVHLKCTWSVPEMHSKEDAFGTTPLSFCSLSRRNQYQWKAEKVSFPSMLVACQLAQMSRWRERNCKVASRQKRLESTWSTPGVHLKLPPCGLPLNRFAFEHRALRPSVSAISRAGA